MDKKGLPQNQESGKNEEFPSLYPYFDPYTYGSLDTKNQSGGININAKEVHIGGDVVNGNKSELLLTKNELPNAYKSAKTAYDRKEFQKALELFNEISETFPGYRDTEKLANLASGAIEHEKIYKIILISYGGVIGAAGLMALLISSYADDPFVLAAAIIGLLGGIGASYLFVKHVFSPRRGFLYRFLLITLIGAIGGAVGVLVVFILLLGFAIYLIGKELLKNQ